MAYVNENTPHTKDDLLRGITFEDLITAVQSNEPVINEKSIKKVLYEMIKENVADAEAELKEKMEWIIKEAR